MTVITFDASAASHHYHAITVFADKFGLENPGASLLVEFPPGLVLGRVILRRGELVHSHPIAGQVVPRIAQHVEKRVVRVDDYPVAPREYANQARCLYASQDGFVSPPGTLIFTLDALYQNAGDRPGHGNVNRSLDRFHTPQ